MGTTSLASGLGNLANAVAFVASAYVAYVSMMTMQLVGLWISALLAFAGLVGLHVYIQTSKEK